MASVFPRCFAGRLDQQWETLDHAHLGAKHANRALDIRMRNRAWAGCARWTGAESADIPGMWTMRNVTDPAGVLPLPSRPPPARGRDLVSAFRNLVAQVTDISLDHDRRSALKIEYENPYVPRVFARFTGPFDPI